MRFFNELQNECVPPNRRLRNSIVSPALIAACVPPNRRLRKAVGTLLQAYDGVPPNRRLRNVYLLRF